MQFPNVIDFRVFVVVDVAVLAITWFFTPFSGLTLEERTVSIFGLNELAEWMLNWCGVRKYVSYLGRFEGICPIQCIASYSSQEIFPIQCISS